MVDENGNEMPTATDNSDPASQQQPQNNGTSGTQQRINELVAQRYQRDEMIAQQQATIAQLVATQTAKAEQVQVPDEVAQHMSQLEQYNPEVAKAMRAIQANMETKFQQQLRQTQNTMEVQGGTRELEQLGAQYRATPATVKRAQDLFAGWKQQGHAFPAADALRFAMGEAAMSPGQTRGNDGRFAPTEAVLRGGSLPPMQQQPPGRPANFENLSPDQQMQWLEASGIDNTTF